MTKKCEHIQCLLDRYLRSELNPTDRESVEAHVGACTGCQSALAFHRSLDSRLDGPVDAPAGLRTRFEAAINAPAPRRSWLTQLIGDPTMKKILLSSTALAAILAGGLMLIPGKAQGSTARQTFETMRKALARAARDGELTVTAAIGPDGLSQVSIMLDGMPLPPDVPVTIVKESGPEFDDFLITIDLSESSFKGIQFGKDHNTLRMIPKAKPDNLDVVRVDPKSGLPTNWSTFGVSKNTLKPLSSVSYKTSDMAIDGPNGTAKTSTTTHDENLGAKTDDDVIKVRMRMAKYQGGASLTIKKNS